MERDEDAKKIISPWRNNTPGARVVTGAGRRGTTAASVALALLDAAHGVAIRHDALPARIGRAVAPISGDHLHSAHLEGPHAAVLNPAADPQRVLGAPRALDAGMAGAGGNERRSQCGEGEKRAHGGLRSAAVWRDPI